MMECNLFTVQKDYFDRLLDEVTGKKVLIVDADVLESISEILAQSDLIAKEVYLVESINLVHQYKDLDAMETVIVVKPTLQAVNTILSLLDGYSLTECYICTSA